MCLIFQSQALCFAPRSPRQAVWIVNTLKNPELSITHFGHRVPILRNKYFLDMVIDMAEMSFHRFLANQNGRLISLLTKLFVWSDLNKLNSTKTKFHDTLYYFEMICLNLECLPNLGLWLGNNWRPLNKGLFTCRWGTPGRWGNPPSRGRKMARVYMQLCNPGVPGWCY